MKYLLPVVLTLLVIVIAAAYTNDKGVSVLLSSYNPNPPFKREERMYTPVTYKYPKSKLSNDVYPNKAIIDESEAIPAPKKIHFKTILETVRYKPGGGYIPPQLFGHGVTPYDYNKNDCPCLSYKKIAPNAF